MKVVRRRAWLAGRGTTPPPQRTWRARWTSSAGSGLRPSWLDHQARDERVAQREPEMQVHDAAGEVTLQVVDHVVVPVIEPGGSGAFDGVGVLAGRRRANPRDLPGRGAGHRGTRPLAHRDRLADLPPHPRLTGDDHAIPGMRRA